MSGLVKAGVKPERLRRSIEQMQRWMGSVEQPLLQLAILEQDGELLVRLDDGLADTSGQRHFDFDDLLESAEVSLPRLPATAEQLFEHGCRNEERGRLNEAAEAYRQALLLGGPDPTICFNLANVLNAMGQKEQAVERYYQVLELNRDRRGRLEQLGRRFGRSRSYARSHRRHGTSPGYRHGLRGRSLQPGRSPRRNRTGNGSGRPLACLCRKGPSWNMGEARAAAPERK